MLPSWLTPCSLNYKLHQLLDLWVFVCAVSWRFGPSITLQLQDHGQEKQFWVAHPHRPLMTSSSNDNRQNCNSTFLFYSTWLIKSSESNSLINICDTFASNLHKVLEMFFFLMHITRRRHEEFRTTTNTIFKCIVETSLKASIKANLFSET